MKRAMRLAVRCLGVVGVVLASASGCASTAGGDAPRCTIDGTYTVTGVRESGNCAVGTESVTDTFTTLRNGDVRLEIQGLADLVPVGTVTDCKWTAAAAFFVLDATGPETKGTVQYSYTFDETGFTGIASVSVPPAKSLPNGCRGTTRATGVRR